MAYEDKWAELTEEQKAKVRSCKTPDELLSMAKEEGYELTDDELEAVAGGNWVWDYDCKCVGDCWRYYINGS